VPKWRATSIPMRRITTGPISKTCSICFWQKGQIIRNFSPTTPFRRTLPPGAKQSSHECWCVYVVCWGGAGTANNKRQIVHGFAQPREKKKNKNKTTAAAACGSYDNTWEKVSIDHRDSLAFRGANRYYIEMSSFFIHPPAAYITWIERCNLILKRPTRLDAKAQEIHQ
jgi:hypothetical protein